MDVSDEWVQGELAVNAFERVCIEHKWPFVPTPANRDFGKDGYVDISDGDTITGETFFVQIKGGRSYAASGGYRIPVRGHADMWINSPAAIVGIVRDPSDDRLRWVNLTSALRADPTQASVLVDQNAVLDDPAQVHHLRASVAATNVDRFVPVGLGSRGTADQGEAVWEAFAMSHRFAEPLIAVRRAFLSLDRTPTMDAILALSHCTPHPDIAWTKDNWLPAPIQQQVSLTFRWNFHEVWMLLTFVDPEQGMQRGSLGQCILMLLLEDPDVLHAIDKVIATTDDEWVLSWASAVALYLAGSNCGAALDELVRLRPDFPMCPLGGVLIDAVRQHGFVALD